MEIIPFWLTFDGRSNLADLEFKPEYVRRVLVGTCGVRAKDGKDKLGIVGALDKRNDCRYIYLCWKIFC